MFVRRLKDYPDILCVVDVMEILGICRKSVYDMIQSSELPGRKIAGSWKIPKSAITTIIRDMEAGVCYNTLDNSSDALPHEKECEK